MTIPFWYEFVKDWCLKTINRPTKRTRRSSSGNSSGGLHTVAENENFPDANFRPRLSNIGPTPDQGTILLVKVSILLEKPSYTNLFFIHLTQVSFQIFLWRQHPLKHKERPIILVTSWPNQSMSMNILWTYIIKD
jgi:hypothetical protein